MFAGAPARHVEAGLYVWKTYSMCRPKVRSPLFRHRESVRSEQTELESLARGLSAPPPIIEALVLEKPGDTDERKSMSMFNVGVFSPWPVGREKWVCLWGLGEAELEPGDVDLRAEIVLGCAAQIGSYWVLAQPGAWFVVPVWSPVGSVLRRLAPDVAVERYCACEMQARPWLRCAPALPFGSRAEIDVFLSLYEEHDRALIRVSVARWRDEMLNQWVDPTPEESKSWDTDLRQRRRAKVSWARQVRERERVEDDAGVTARPCAARDDGDGAGSEEEDEGGDGDGDGDDKAESAAGGGKVRDFSSGVCLDVYDPRSGEVDRRWLDLRMWSDALRAWVARSASDAEAARAILHSLASPFREILLDPKGLLRTEWYKYMTGNRKEMHLFRREAREKVRRIFFWTYLYPDDETRPFPRHLGHVTLCMYAMIGFFALRVRHYDRAAETWGRTKSSIRMRS